MIMTDDDDDDDDDDDERTYTVAGSRSSSIASLILRRCKLDSSLSADSSSASLRPSKIYTAEVTV